MFYNVTTTITKRQITKVFNDRYYSFQVVSFTITAFIMKNSGISVRVYYSLYTVLYIQEGFPPKI